MIRRIKYNQINGFLFICCSIIFFCVSPSIAGSSMVIDEAYSIYPQMPVSVANPTYTQTQRNVFKGFYPVLDENLVNNNNDNPDNLKEVNSSGGKNFSLTCFLFILLIASAFYIKIFLPAQSPRSPPGGLTLLKASA
jgi:hypothetical protein